MKKPKGIYVIYVLNSLHLFFQMLPILILLFIVTMPEGDFRKGFLRGAGIEGISITACCSIMLSFMMMILAFAVGSNRRYLQNKVSGKGGV
ncbi:MAG: hypothetical protein GX234_00500 [Clostridiales bacterium]|nr:hypothetical protein [Clostridiales bacterium]